MSRKPHLTPEQAEEAREMYRGPWTVRQIARYLGVSMAVVNAALNRTGAYASYNPDAKGVKHVPSRSG